MDGQRFDSLAKTVATVGSRRAFLRGIAGGLALLMPGGRALAAPSGGHGNKPAGDKCNQHFQCQTGYCDPATGTCGYCSTNADCDDGDPCTYDVCGSSSHHCFHDPIPDCRACTGSGRCPHGGECCAGRCCPVGSVCGVNGFGVTTCCAACSGGTPCCDLTDSQEYLVNVCFEPCGFCCPGTAHCEVLSDGSVRAVECVLPGNSR